MMLRELRVAKGRKGEREKGRKGERERTCVCNFKYGTS